MSKYNNIIHNYHNIIPVILIDVIIILLFEGIVFFLFLAKEQEKTVINEIGEALNTNRKKSTDNAELALDLLIQKSINNEEEYINKEYTKGVIFYTCIVIGILIILCIYVYVVYKKLHKHIDWKFISCVVFITFVLIMLLEGLFIKYVLFNKQFNGLHLKLDFINALTQ